MKKVKETLILAAIMAASATLFGGMMYILMMVSYILGTW